MIFILFESIFRRQINGLRQKTPAEKNGLLFMGALFVIFYLILVKHLKLFFIKLSELQPEIGIVYGISLFLLYAFIYLFLVGMSTDIRFLDHNPDLSLLIPMPIAPHVLWFYKLTEILVSKSFFIILCSTLTLSVGFLFNAPFIFYLVIPVFLTGFFFIPLAAGTLAVSLPFSGLKTKGLQFIFRLLAWSVSLLMWLIFISIINPIGFAFMIESLNLPELEVIPFMDWMPPGMLSISIGMLLAGKTFSAVLYGLPLIILPFGLFHFVRLNFISKALFHEPVHERKKKNDDRVATSFHWGPLATVLSSMTISSIRDHDYCKQKLLSMFTIVILILLAQRHYFRLLLFYLTLFPMLSMCVDATLIFREGKSFWWFKVRQDKIFYFVLSKFLVSFLGSLTLVTSALGCLVMVYGHYWTVEIVAIGWLRLLAVCLCFAGLSMAVGSMFPNFKHPKYKLNASGYSCIFIFMIIGIVYSAFNMDLLRESASLQIIFELMIAIVIVWGSLKKATHDLEKMEWEL